jgi:putative ABC transport system permease protein
VRRVWLLWSWRDLRARWVQVTVIAMIIGLGTGSYAGLTSTTVWRKDSNEASYALTNVFDIRTQLGAGNFVEAGRMSALIEDLIESGAVDAAEERLLLPTQIETESPGGTVLVPARVVGIDLSAGGPLVNRLHTVNGRGLQAEDAGRPIAVLEHNFAGYYELPPQGSLRLTEGRELGYVGDVLSPEYFIVVTEDGGFYAHPNFAAVFTSIETARAAAGLEGVVNDLVISLSVPAERERVAAELAPRFAAIGATVTAVDDDPSYRLLTEDPDGDQQLFTVIALATFAGAVFAAFNLTARMIEAQRREIGIAMALGVPRWRIAMRPLFVGAQIALLGVVFGVLIGSLIGWLMAGVIDDLLPLPVWRTPFQPQLFAGVAAAGIVVPLVAITYPVWRAVGVAPVDAIRTGHLAARGGGFAPLLRRLPTPGGTFAAMPFRNLVRAPRRAVLTLLGIAAAIAVLITVGGMVDSFLGTIDRGAQEVSGDAPDRLTVAFDSFYPVEAGPVAVVGRAPTLDRAEPALRLGATFVGREEFDVMLQLIDLESDLWRPTVTSGEVEFTAPGLLLAESAAEDLGVGVGDVVTLRHPVRTGDTFALVESDLPVIALHPHPFRFVTYMDLRHAGLLGLAGLANEVSAVPAAGASDEAVRRELFGMPGVSSVQSVTASADVIDDIFGEVVGILRVIEGAVLLLVLLIAFNAAGLNMDERRREHATMFAFGTPLRTVLRIAVVESLTIGVLATAAGIAGGYALLRWMLAYVVTDTAPDIGVAAIITPTTLTVVVVLGILAVATAPLLTFRRLRGMDIPSTLRVME